MKNIIAVEVNSRKDNLGNFTFDTPEELILSNNTEAILNNRIFEDLMDDMFLFLTNEAREHVGRKINNAFITFINDYDEFICSVKMSHMSKLFGTYVIEVIDWEKSEYTFKFQENENDEEGSTE